MKKIFLPVMVVIFLFASTATAQLLQFKDPSGDDNGPGTYKYPTDTVYQRGSFDLISFNVDVGGGDIFFDIETNSTIENPWKSDKGFSVQMILIFIDTKKGGFTQLPPGINAVFADGHEWDKLIILSPLDSSRLKQEVSRKMSSEQRSAVIIPSLTKAANRTIAALTKLDLVGDGDPREWGYQVLMLGSESFPAGNDFLIRRVNEFEGNHRFGGGNDGDCDSNIIDLLTGKAAGEKSEIDLQKKMLAYECRPDGASKKISKLNMVRK